MKHKIIFLGDVHGHYRAYSNICKEAERKGHKTIQLGDMGFCYDHFKGFNLDPENHVFLGGNHDNYNLIVNCPNYLGDFGVRTINGLTFFFIRGAYSIDKASRKPGISWWDKEELSYSELVEAIKLYEKVKPDFVISHTVCDSVKQRFIDGKKAFDSRTEKALQEMVEIWQPEFWAFGHFHLNREIKIGKTQFVCLKELAQLEI